ncbi:MAG: hypothetical protein MO852_05025 [Candidatus Devosia euplotis]|nr:hypothetical protein [Candidatus Devosia euplotis]
MASTPHPRGLLEPDHQRRDIDCIVDVDDPIDAGAHPGEAVLDVFRRGRVVQGNFVRGSATANDLFFVAERVLGERRAAALFETTAREIGVDPDQLELSSEFIGKMERELAGSIGAASAHVMLSKVVSDSDVLLEEVM